jgi:hypothetical protein
VKSKALKIQKKKNHAGYLFLVAAVCRNTAALHSTPTNAPLVHYRVLRASKTTVDPFLRWGLLIALVDVDIFRQFLSLLSPSLSGSNQATWHKT